MPIKVASWQTKSIRQQNIVRIGGTMDQLWSNQ